MNNRTYVCFTCRTTARVTVGRITQVCRQCRALAEHVYYKFKIPRRGDDAGWEELQMKVRADNRTLKSTALARLRQERAKRERLLGGTPQSQPARQRSASNSKRCKRRRSNGVLGKPVRSAGLVHTRVPQAAYFRAAVEDLLKKYEESRPKGKR